MANRCSYFSRCIETPYTQTHETPTADAAKITDCGFCINAQNTCMCVRWFCYKNQIVSNNEWTESKKCPHQRLNFVGAAFGCNFCEIFFFVSSRLNVDKSKAAHGFIWPAQFMPHEKTSLLLFFFLNFSDGWFWAHTKKYNSRNTTHLMYLPALIWYAQIYHSEIFEFDLFVLQSTAIGVCIYVQLHVYLSATCKHQTTNTDSHLAWYSTAIWEKRLKSLEINVSRAFTCISISCCGFFLSAVEQRTLRSHDVLGCLIYESRFLDDKEKKNNDTTFFEETTLWLYIPFSIAFSQIYLSITHFSFLHFVRSCYLPLFFNSNKFPLVSFTFHLFRAEHLEIHCTKY